MSVLDSFLAVGDGFGGDLSDDAVLVGALGTFLGVFASVVIALVNRARIGRPNGHGDLATMMETMLARQQALEDRLGDVAERQAEHIGFTTAALDEVRDRLSAVEGAGRAPRAAFNRRRR